MSTFLFDLVSPERLLLSEQTVSVTVPGVEGEFEVLAGHAPLISTLKPGIVTVRLAGATPRQFFVRGGFAEATPEALTILAEHAVPVEEMDAASFDAAIQDATEDVADATTDDVRQKAQERLTQLQDMKTALAGVTAGSTVH